MTPKPLALKSIDSLSLITFPHHLEDNGSLIVMEELKNVPFKIARVFVVLASVGSIRGEHAHRLCSQLLTCPTGSIEVLCDDGSKQIKYFLNKPNLGLLLPPGIWAKQTYLDQNSVLTVLCDRPYEVDDYIRDYNEFKTYREIQPNV